MEALKDMLSAAWSQFDSQVLGVVPEDGASSLEAIDAVSTVKSARSCKDDEKVQTEEKACSEACSLVPKAVLEEDSRHFPPDTVNPASSESTIIHTRDQKVQPEDEIYMEACTESDAQVPVTVHEENSSHFTPYSDNLAASEPIRTCVEDQNVQDEVYAEACSEVESEVYLVVPEEENRYSSLDSEYLSDSEPITTCVEDQKVKNEDKIDTEACGEVDSQVPTAMPEEDNRHSSPLIGNLIVSEPITACTEDLKVEDEEEIAIETGSEVDSQVPTAVPEEFNRHSLSHADNLTASEPITACTEDQKVQDTDKIDTEACSEVDSQVPIAVPEENSRHSSPHTDNLSVSEPITACMEDLKVEYEEEIDIETCSEVNSWVPTAVPDEDKRHSTPDTDDLTGSEPITTCTEDQKVEDTDKIDTEACSEVDSQVPTIVPEEDSRHSSPDTDNLSASEPITACTEGMESPFKPEARRMYEREFLVNLQHTSESMKFPENVPILSCFKKKKKQKKKSSKSEPAAVMASSNVDVLQLNWSDNPWKPRFMETSSSSDKNNEAEEMLRKVRGMLNKVTGHKFTTFLALMCTTLPIDGKKEMEKIVGLIYKKAVNEPLYCRVYAQMCKVLSVLLLPTQLKHREHPQYANFCELLLNCCQVEFEKDPEVELRRENWFTQIEAALPPWEREELKFNFEEKERRIRRRFVGNVRFMAEIFKLEMMAITTMHCCIAYLIQGGDEISLECLCVLLTHVGRYMESKHEDLSLYFTVMEAICESKGRVSSRLRFMLMDVTDLRQNKWIPRNNTQLVLQEFTLQPSKARRRKRKAALDGDSCPGDAVGITESEKHDSSSVQLECVSNNTIVHTGSVLVSEDKHTQNVGLPYEEELYKMVRDVLNKKTAHKFTELVSQLTDRPPKSRDQLQGVVVIIYVKAMEEPSLSVAYAQLCRALSDMEVSLEKEYEHLIETVCFKKLLVEHCDFEARKNSEVKLMRETRKKEIREMTDMAVVKKLQCELEEEEQIRRIKFQAHVRFIADLYKVGMLTKKTIRFYIYQLLKEANEESLEYLCILLTTAGKDMENDNMDLSKYFTKIKELCDVGNDLPERTRCMLQDLIKLRQSWLPQSNLNPEPSVAEQKKVLDQQSLLLGAHQQDGDTALGQESSSSLQSGENKEVGAASLLSQEMEEVDPVKMKHDKVLQKLHKMAVKLDLTVPNKFTELAAQIEVLPVGNTRELQLLVDFIHEKALHEPAYYNQYTKISKVLSEMMVPRESRQKNKDEYVTFEELLRKRCQLELKKIPDIELHRKVRLQEIEAIADMIKKRELQLKLEEQTQIWKMRAVANVRFIGELYKYGIINVYRLHENVGDLINGCDETSLECLCVLFTIVGKRLKVMDQDLTGYFIVLQGLYEWQGLSDHIKCMLRELIELWENDWVPQSSSGQIQKEPQKLAVEERLPPSVVVNIPQQQDLTKSEDALQPAHEVCTTAIDAKPESLLPSTSEIMEKLDKKYKNWIEMLPQELIELLSQIGAMPMTNGSEVQKIVTLIHEKAVNNPHLSKKLAKVCNTLNDLPKVPHGTSRQGRRIKYTTFKKLMVKWCEAKVKDVESEQNREVRLREIAAASDPVKQELQLRFEEDKELSRRRALANIRFIGELYLAGYEVHIIRKSIKHLFIKNNEESLESICVLLTLVGKRMEEMDQNLTEYFWNLTEIHEYEGTPHHIKDMIMLLLRARGWFPQHRSDQVQEECSSDSPQQEDARTNDDVVFCCATEGNPQSADRIHTVTEDVSELTAVPQQLVAQTEDEGAASLLVLEKKAPEKIKVMRLNNKKVLEKLHKTAVKTVPNVLFRLVTHIESIPLNNTDELQNIISLICEVAVNESELSHQCAKLCKALAEFQVPRESASGELEFVTFKQLLVKHCKNEVEKVINLKVKRKAVLKKATRNSEVKKKQQLQLEDEEQRFRLTAVGITRFVGELFKLWVLNIGNIYALIRCINKHGNEESLKCLCLLFTAVGKRMEDADVDLSKNFAALKKVSSRAGISDELKLMIQELIDLKENGWIPQSKSSSTRSCRKTEPMPLSDVVDQQAAESNWSSSFQRQSVSSSGEDGAASLMELEKREKIFKKVHTQLNELMEKEKSCELRLLVSRILALPMNRRDDLLGVVTFIYEKAVNEPDLCILCAQICKVLTDIRTETLDFRQLLVAHCQREFEKCTEVEPKARETDAPSVSARKPELKLMLQEGVKAQLRAIRNVRFFGELFNIGVLSFHIMNVCIKHLLEVNDELSVTRLCVLFTTVGHKMDVLQLNLSKHVTKMNKQWGGESECFRVLLQRVSELAESNWIRQTGSHVKTVDQIQKLAEKTILDVQQDDTTLHETNHSGDLSEKSDSSSPAPQLVSTDTEEVTALLSAFQQKLTEELKYSKTCKMYERVCQLLQKEESHRLIPIMTQIVALPISNIHELEVIVDLIYKKAVDEPDPYNCYSQLCKALSGLQVMGVDFRKLLLNCCQKEFAKNTQVELKRGEIESVSDPEKKRELQLQLEEEERILRLRAVRNARFVGELFNLGIPSPKVIHNCMKQLLEKRNEELMARLCVLLATVGQTMESQKQSVSKYVEKMELMTTMWGEEPLKVLIHDVLVLWQHDWVGQGNAELKSADQIQEMAEKIMSGMQFRLQNVPISSCEMPIGRSSPDTSCSDSVQFRSEGSRTTESVGSDLSLSRSQSVSPSTEGRSAAVFKLNTMKKLNIPENSDDERLYRDLHEILVKELPLLFTRYVIMRVKNKKQLQLVVDLIYEKAMEEPSFCFMCGQIVKMLGPHQVPKDDTNTFQNVNLRKLLINHCQAEFEKNFEARPNMEIKLKEIEAASDQKEKMELQLKLEEDQRRIHLRSLRNVRFIGEVCKFGMLSMNIISHCIRTLLKEENEVLLACLCVLLANVGIVMENKSQDLSEHFARITQILETQKGISDSLRVLVQDVFELWQHNWVQQGDSNLKTVDQIQEMAEKIIQDMQLLPRCSLSDLQQDDRTSPDGNCSDGMQATDDAGSTTESDASDVTSSCPESVSSSLEGGAAIVSVCSGESHHDT